MVESSMKNKVFGGHISLERTIYAIVDIRGDILARDEFPSTDYPNINDFVSVLSERLVDMMLTNNCMEGIRSIGISVSNANPLTNCLENAVNLPWKGVIPLAAMIRDRVGLAVALANKPHARAMGEYVFGAAHGMRNFVIISIGHGLGSFIFSNGIPYLGSDGYAGEVGHTMLYPHGRRCNCGNEGCLEVYTAAKGIVTTAQELMAKRSEPSLMRDIEKLSPRKIVECCEQGDALAIETMQLTGEHLGLGLANYASLVDPEAFIFTGGVARGGKWFLDKTEETYNKYVFNNTKGKTRFLLSSLEDKDHDLLGASVLAWQVEEYSLFT